MRKISLSHKIRSSFRGHIALLHPHNPAYKWFVLANIMMGTFMAVLDSTIVNVGLPKIMSSFGVGLDTIQWVVTAYMLAMAVMLPTSGWMADKFGYKKMYFWGMFLFTIGSLLCALSSNENTLIISRIIQGLGAGAVQPLGMAIITREFPPKQRGIALGFWTIAAAASVSFGPLLGGYLVDNFNWSLIFFINVPVGFFALFSTIVIQREFKSPNARKFDFVGFLSVIIFLPVLLYALSEGNSASNSSGWSAPYILLCFAISAIAFVVFITREFTTDSPLLNLRLLGNRNFGLANLFMMVFGLGMFGSTFLLPLYLQNSLGYTALQSGAVFLPVGIIQGITSPLVGLVSDKTNPKIPLLIGIVLLATSFFISYHFSYLTEHSYIMMSLYIRGFGMGLIFAPLSTMSLATISREDMAQASSITNTVRQIGGSLGVAILSTLLTSRTNFHSQVYGQAVNTYSQTYQNVSQNLAYHIQQHAGSSLATALKQGHSLISQHINTEAFIRGVNDDFFLAGVITVFGLIPVLLSRSYIKKKAK